MIDPSCCGGGVEYCAVVEPGLVETLMFGGMPVLAPILMPYGFPFDSMGEGANVGATAAPMPIIGTVGFNGIGDGPKRDVRSSDAEPWIIAVDGALSSKSIKDKLLAPDPAPSSAGMGFDEVT
jgi:hypothetical protein